MNPKSCLLCGQAVEVESADMCSKCFAMAERISFLIENHREKAQYFLDEKYKEITQGNHIVSDRRKKKYEPPQGPHTPDRRVRTRRVWQMPNSPKRRKTDWTE